MNNPRTHSREQVANIAASIQEFGWTNPVLVDGDDGILAGHARVLAARKLGMKEIPVIVLRHLSEAQRRALVIADNQLAIAGAGWDEDLLRIELAILREEDYDLNLVGFDDIELQRLLEAQDAAPFLTEPGGTTAHRSKRPSGAYYARRSCWRIHRNLYDTRLIGSYALISADSRDSHSWYARN